MKICEDIFCFIYLYIYFILTVCNRYLKFLLVLSLFLFFDFFLILFVNLLFSTRNDLSFITQSSYFCHIP